MSDRCIRIEQCYREAIIAMFSAQEEAVEKSRGRRGRNWA